MTTFIQQMNVIADNAIANAPISADERYHRFQIKRDMSKITCKYHSKLSDAIYVASVNGKKETCVNFDVKDFTFSFNIKSKLYKRQNMKLDEVFRVWFSDMQNDIPTFIPDVNEEEAYDYYSFNGLSLVECHINGGNSIGIRVKW